MLEDVGRGIVEQWLQCGQVHTAIQDVLQSLLGLQSGTERSQLRLVGKATTGTRWRPGNEASWGGGLGMRLGSNN